MGGSEGGDKHRKLWDVSYRFKHELIEGLRSRDDGVGIVESRLCSLESPDGPIESGAMEGKISGAFTSGLQGSHQLFDVS